MLDTVILQIPIGYSAITDPDQFSPSARIIERSQGFSRYVNNPTKKDKEKWGYMPRLTILKRGNRIYLKIEFSAPKLLFGNNLDELEENNFDEIVSKIQEKTRNMGVMLWTHQIENAEVISFHPSKNIPLSKGYTSSFAIRELSKINFSQKLDIEKISFRNNGESLQFYSNQHSFVLYDKIRDLSKPLKRAIDKDQTKRQTSLFEYIKNQKKHPEVLRFEVRLSYKRKMLEVLKEVGFTDTPLFKNIFKKDICQRIVKLYWERFFGKNMFLFSVSNNPQNILQIVLREKPRTKIKTAIYLIGLYLLFKDNEGVRGFRTIAKNYRPKNNWATTSRYLKNFEDDIFKYPQHGFIEDIEKSLDEFKPFRIKSEDKSY